MGWGRFKWQYPLGAWGLRERSELGMRCLWQTGVQSLPWQGRGKDLGEERKAEKQMLNSKTFRRSHVMEQEPRKTIHKVESERCPQDVILLEKSKKKNLRRRLFRKLFPGVPWRISRFPILCTALICIPDSIKYLHLLMLFFILGFLISHGNTLSNSI